MTQNKIICKEISELEDIAKKLLADYPDRRIFAFYGKMGVGKTTFIKALCKTLGVVNITNSPSYSIVNEYTGKEGNTIYHFDFYRIKNINEVFDIGYEDYFFSDNYCFIEWPEKIKDLLPDDSIKIYIKENPLDNSRIIKIQ